MRLRRIASAPFRALSARVGRLLASVETRRKAKARLALGSVGLSVAGGLLYSPPVGLAVFSVYLILDGLFLVPTGDRR